MQQSTRYPHKALGNQPLVQDISKCTKHVNYDFVVVAAAVVVVHFVYENKTVRNSSINCKYTQIHMWKND